MATFGERLRKARLMKGMKQVDLAKKMGVTRSVISRYELGINDPPSENIGKLAEILGVSADYLLGRTDNPEGNNKAVDISALLDAILHEKTLPDAMLRISEMADEYNLPDEVVLYFIRRARKKFNLPAVGSMAAHGPRQPGLLNHPRSRDGGEPGE